MSAWLERGRTGAINAATHPSCRHERGAERALQPQGAARTPVAKYVLRTPFFVGRCRGLS